LFTIEQTIARLQQKNDKAYYLAVLRVLVSLWFIKEMFFRWPAFEVLYSSNSFLKLDSTHSLQIFGLNAHFLKEHYMMLVIVCILLLLLNLFGIGRNLVSLLLFLAFTVLYHLDNMFANSGDEMSMLLLFYLSFANTFSHLTLFKRKPLSPQKEKIYNLISNLAAYSMMVNLCLSYFMAGVFKASDPYWQKGTGIYYFVNDDRYSVFAAGGKHVDFPLILSYIFNYGTLLLEFCFPFLVWHKKYRNIVFIICLLMHLGIYAFLMIYGMTVIFIIQYGMFYSNEEVMAVVEKIKLFFRKRFKFAVANSL
jgi:hypothetical protein